MRKRVWIFNHYAEPPQYEVRVRNNVMAKYLMQAGYDVTIFAASTIHNTDINLITDGSAYIRREYDGLKFVHVKAPNYSGNGMSRKINMLLFPFNLWRITRTLGETPDVIVNDLNVMAMDFPFMIAKRYHVPIITEVRDLWPESIIACGLLDRNSLLAKFLYFREKTMYKKSDRVVFSMEGGYDYIKEQGWEKTLPADKAEYINNGVDLQVYLENREKYQLQDPDLDDPDTFKVVYAGSIRKANGLEELVECASRLRGYPKIKFLVYGQGDDLEPLRQRCEAEKLENIVFKGSVAKDYIPYILSKSDLNVLNYNAGTVDVYRFGSSQNKLFEYFASGKPVLSNVSIAYSLIDRYECGISENLTTGEQYAEAVLKLYNMPKDAYDQMCANARQAANDFDFKTLTGKLISLIESIEK